MADNELMRQPQMKIHKVKTIDGQSAELWSDDTFTLHFGSGFEYQCESTPRDLAEAISLESLRFIADNGDRNEQEKAEKAIGFIK